MARPAGTRLGNYEILSLLGVGGMGEVYRATDTKLKRNVALKLLPEAFARDPGRMARFHREAEVLASLNHPNIAAIYGVEENALVMELVEGQTLPGPLPLDIALNYARQMAEALEYAHERGVIHRDLKPSNVKVTPEGTVKLLDFGLAKAIEDPASPAIDPSHSPTLTLGATQAGAIMGTAAYMSPEQANGKPADRRSDIWSFGAVLYEMLSGKQAFGGDSASDMLASVLKLDPDWGALPASTPASIKQLIRRCLMKDRKQRLQAIGEARIVLENPVAEAAVTIPSRPAGFGTVPWIAAALLAVVAIVALWAPWRTPPEARVVASTILPPDGAVFDFITTPGPPAISPDGRRLVFSARSADGKIQLWIRSLSSQTSQPLAGTENPRFPFWSPDGKSIGFFADGKLKTIDAAGGPPLTLAVAPIGHGGTWSPGGIIVFSPSETGTLQQVRASGGTASAATTLDVAKERAHKFPWFLPDGRHFLFTSQITITGEPAIQVASLDSKEARIIARTNSNAIYADGRLLFLRENTLMAQPFDANRLVATGDAVPVAEHLGHIFLDPGGLFSAAHSGLLVYQAVGGVGSTRLTWFDRGGKSLGTLADAGDFGSIALSPDQKSLAASVDDSNGNRDIWIYDVARGLRTRFTFDPAADELPVWSPDGRRIVFRSNRRGDFNLYRKSADGSGVEELLSTTDSPTQAPGSWAPDGRLLLYSVVGQNTSNDIWVLPMPEQADRAKSFPFLQTPFRELWPQVSPDGRWMAYQSDESQQYEIYVAPFQGTSPSTGGKRQISTNGGTFPRWRKDGKEIFYVGPDSRLMAAQVNINGSTIEVKQVRPLGIPVVTTGGYHYDVSADGQRFLVVTAPERNTSPPLTLVQNWAAGLKK